MKCSLRMWMYAVRVWHRPNRLRDGWDKHSCVCLRQRVETAVRPSRQESDSLSHTETLRWGRRRRKQEGVASEQTALLHWAAQMSTGCQSVCHSKSNGSSPGPVILRLLRFAPSLFLEAERPGFRSRQQDASSCRTHSGGRDEDATIFCGERCVDPDRDQPHVSEVYPLKWDLNLWEQGPSQMSFEINHLTCYTQWLWFWTALKQILNHFLLYCWRLLVQCKSWDFGCRQKLWCYIRPTHWINVQLIWDIAPRSK